MLPGSYARQA